MVAVESALRPAGEYLSASRSDEIPISEVSLGLDELRSAFQQPEVIFRVQQDLGSSHRQIFTHVHDALLLTGIYAAQSLGMPCYNNAQHVQECDQQYMLAEWSDTNGAGLEPDQLSLKVRLRGSMFRVTTKPDILATTNIAEFVRNLQITPVLRKKRRIVRSP